MRLLTSLFLFLFINAALGAQDIYKPNKWADSTLKTMSLEEKIGQLFMVAAYSNKDAAHQQSIAKLVEQQKIGGLIFMQGGPVRQAKQNNVYQSKAKIPLMIAMDAEWGAAMRLDSVISYPKQMTLGAIQDDKLIEKMGQQIGQELRRLGVHVSFSPVVDVNNNAKNPVINIRSFGENKENVANKGVAYMSGLQKAKVLANAKHFPGHGDTDADSHYTLPLVNHNKARLDSIELYPFKKLIKNNVGSMMVAHLYLPKIDSTKNRASTLSPIVVNDMLKKELGFKGLIFTDALNMKGVSQYYKPGEVELEALKAGNHVLLFPENVPLAVETIKNALNKGEITLAQVDEAVLKILQAKHWLGLTKPQKVALKNLSTDLNSPAGNALRKQLIEASQTLVQNKGNLIPLKDLSQLKVAALAVGDVKDNAFQSMLKKYGKVETFAVPKQVDSRQIETLKKNLAGYDVVIISLHKVSVFPKNNYGLTAEMASLVKALADLPVKKIINFYGNPYATNSLQGLDKYESVLYSFEENVHAQQAAAQVIFGALSASGKLPVNANIFSAGKGISTEKPIRLGYAMPEELNINGRALKKRVDSLVFEAMLQKATPGAVVLATKNGKIIYEQAYGDHTYEKFTPVETHHLYDVASVTKVASTTLALMRLHYENKIDIDQTLGFYLPWIPKELPHADLTLKEILAHQAGLPSWIPFFQKTLSKAGDPRELYYNQIKSDIFPWQVADNLYMQFAYRDSIFQRIINTPLKKKEYKYSDLGLILLAEIVETVTNTNLDYFVDSIFYKPMGLYRITYKPKEKFGLAEIVPTEQEKNFRRQLIHGHVHDPAAAMLGGVAGHAGLFSDAFSLASLGEMLLNNGVYGGVTYLDKKTIELFTSCQFCDTNRRGAGWDKPLKEGGGPTFRDISGKSYGHTGFTGTIWWIDPVEKITYVFLSNRVYPTAENKKLQTGNFRPGIHKAIYQVAANKK
ncbi:MAG: glycoside hydrolase family 3 N-terminal domain-containing protein [Luteibaculaceae bacterium]